MTRTANWIYAILGFDSFIQALGIAASIVGVICTIYALSEFMRVRRVTTSVQRMISNEHVWGQISTLAVQVIFLLINAAVLTLPPIPVVMYQDQSEGGWIILVILTRKVLRLAAIIILTSSSVHRVITFHRIMAHLNDRPGHYHRRETDA